LQAKCPEVSDAQADDERLKEDRTIVADEVGHEVMKNV